MMFKNRWCLNCLILLTFLTLQNFYESLSTAYTLQEIVWLLIVYDASLIFLQSNEYLIYGIIDNTPDNLYLYP